MSPNHLEQAGRVFPQNFLRTANAHPWSQAPPSSFVLRTFLKLYKPEPCYSQIDKEFECFAKEKHLVEKRKGEGMGVKFSEKKSIWSEKEN